MKTKRIDLRIPEALVEEVEKYQREQMITTRSQTFLELIRKGIKAK